MTGTVCAASDSEDSAISSPANMTRTAGRCGIRCIACPAGRSRHFVQKPITVAACKGHPASLWCAHRAASSAALETRGRGLAQMLRARCCSESGAATATVLRSHCERANRCSPAFGDWQTSTTSPPCQRARCKGQEPLSLTDSQRALLTLILHIDRNQTGTYYIDGRYG